MVAKDFDGSWAFDDIVERFESLARARRAPAIEQVLAEAAEPLTVEVRSRLLLELVAVDLEYRWQTPHRRGPLIEHYFKRLRSWATLDDVPMELIAEEYRVRHRFGDTPAHAEYIARFPRHGQKLLVELARVDADLWREYPSRPNPPVVASVTAIAELGVVSSLDYRDFAIRRLIAMGGMSRVYTAMQKSTQRPVALKVLQKSLASDARSVYRFHREARIATSLASSGVVGVIGLGRFPDGGHFMALRLVDGPDLSRLPGGVPLHSTLALNLSKAIGALMEQVHIGGWLHCDLKPSNVLIDSTGAPWITDFAMAQPWPPLAEVLHDDGHFALGGTPAFMAPEQFVGDARLLSPATDIFGMGGVMYYLLTGSTPRSAQELSHGEGARVRWELLEQVDARWRRILQRCLADDAKERYSSSRDLLADLSCLDDPHSTYASNEKLVDT